MIWHEWIAVAILAICVPLIFVILGWMLWVFFAICVPDFRRWHREDRD